MFIKPKLETIKYNVRTIKDKKERKKIMKEKKTWKKILLLVMQLVEPRKRF